MGINRLAKGIVLVPCLLLGVAFLCAALWGDTAAAANRPLAFTLAGLLLTVALLSQLLPEAAGNGPTEPASKAAAEVAAPSSGESSVRSPAD